MKLIPDIVKRCWRCIPRGCMVTAIVLAVLASGVAVLAYAYGAKYAGTVTMVVIYFFHLLIGAGGGYAILRLWYYRDNPLIVRMGVYMFASPIGALTSIVLIFMAKGVTLTWKYSITMFTGGLLSDLVRIPFIIYMGKGDDPHAPAVPLPQPPDAI